MKITPMVSQDASFWITMKQASQYIVDFGNFVKELISDPGAILERGINGLQNGIEPIVLIVIATIILLKMIGFKDMEKWGILALITYIVIMIL